MAVKLKPEEAEMLSAFEELANTEEQPKAGSAPLKLPPRKPSSVKTEEVLKELGITKDAANKATHIPVGNTAEQGINATQPETKRRGVKPGEQRGPYNKGGTETKQKKGKKGAEPLPVGEDGKPKYDVVGSILQGTLLPGAAVLMKRDPKAVTFQPHQIEMLKDLAPDSQPKKSWGLYLLVAFSSIAANVMSAPRSGFSPTEFFAFIDNNPGVIEALKLKYNLTDTTKENESKSTGAPAQQ